MLFIGNKKQLILSGILIENLALSRALEVCRVEYGGCFKLGIEVLLAPIPGLGMN